jgi:hypothetical protein
MENLSPLKGDLIEAKNDVRHQRKTLKGEFPTPESPWKNEALNALLCPHLPHKGAINAGFGSFSNAAHIRIEDFDGVDDEMCPGETQNGLGISPENSYELAF